MDQPAGPAPPTLEALFQSLADRVGTQPKRLRQCADFIARNPDRIAVSTVAELAALADVQPSAMMRFCQDLGSDRAQCGIRDDQRSRAVIRLPLEQLVPGSALGCRNPDSFP